MPAISGDTRSGFAVGRGGSWPPIGRSGWGTVSASQQTLLWIVLIGLTALQPPPATSSHCKTGARRQGFMEEEDLRTKLARLEAEALALRTQLDTVQNHLKRAKGAKERDLVQREMALRNQIASLDQRIAALENRMGPPPPGPVPNSFVIQVVREDSRRRKRRSKSGKYVEKVPVAVQDVQVLEEQAIDGNNRHSRCDHSSAGTADDTPWLVGLFYSKIKKE